MLVAHLAPAYLSKYHFEMDIDKGTDIAKDHSNFLQHLKGFAALTTTLIVLMRYTGKFKTHSSQY